ncbi:hypothetical protein KC349_g169 [Hortaea werneckii]|nr:hypothetical protein KC349_g169 [Hortaea werneckii]
MPFAITLASNASRSRKRNGDLSNGSSRARRRLNRLREYGSLQEALWQSYWCLEAFVHELQARLIGTCINCLGNFIFLSGAAGSISSHVSDTLGTRTVSCPTNYMDFPQMLLCWSATMSNFHLVFHDRMVEITPCCRLVER